MGNVAKIWRHPIKSLGREALEAVRLSAGKTMPWDRTWAVTHGDTKFNAQAPEWTKCRSFVITSMTPGLAGVWAELDEATASVKLSHQDLGSIRFCPDNPDNVAPFLSWMAPLCPAEGRQPTGIAKAPGRGMTDSDYPTISIMTNASHQAVEARLERKLEQERWRGNIWLDGPAEWEEMSWVGKRLRIGSAVLEVHEPIERCKATMANPVTGQRDVDTLKTLREGWDHQYFGMYATVIEDGDLSLGDGYEVL